MAVGESGTTARVVRWLVATATVCSFAAIAACQGGLVSVNEIQVLVTVSASGTGDARVLPNEQPSGNPNFAIDCRIKGGATAGSRCSDTFKDSGRGGTFTVVIQQVVDTVVTLGGDCVETSGNVCTMHFPPGGNQEISAVIVVDTFPTPVDTTTPPASITLSDDFSGGCGQWTATAVVNGPVVATEGCPATGGSDGGAYRSMTHTFSGPGNLTVDHAFDGGTITVGPNAPGVICGSAIRFTEKRIITAGTAMGASSWVIQNGARYRLDLNSYTDQNWVTRDTGPATAADFTAPGLDLCPATPTVLTFGYARSNSTGAASNLISGGLDEWSVTISP